MRAPATASIEQQDIIPSLSDHTFPFRCGATSDFFWASKLDFQTAFINLESLTPFEPNENITCTFSRSSNARHRIFRSPLVCGATNESGVR